MTPTHYLKGARLLSYRAYVILLIACWSYTFIWAGALVALWHYWDELAVYYKVGFGLILIVGTPTISDLVESYQKYKAQWNEDNPALANGQERP